METRSFGKMNKAVLRAVLLAAVLTLMLVCVPARAHAADSGIPDDYDPIPNGPPHVRMRDVFETETINVSGIKVVEVREDIAGNTVWTDPEDAIRFRIYNTTTQETELGGPVETVKGEDGCSYLPPMELKKGHDYIFFVEDANYRYPRGENHPSAGKVYAQIRPGDTVTAQDGPGAYNYLTDTLRYGKIEEIAVERRESPCADPFAENRYDTGSNNTITVRYNGGGPRAGIKFRLVSDVETIDTVTETGGVFRADLIEGVTYMVYLMNDSYSIDPFPIVAKDKTEYGEGLYCYNHSTCVKVDSITLYDKGDTEFDGLSRNTTVDSLKGRSTVTGMNFKNLLIVDRVLDVNVDGLSGKDYEVISVCAVNPTRWEISKLKGTDFGITWKECRGKLVSHVYVMGDGGALSEIGFRQSSADDVSFTMDSLSLRPVLIEYDSSMIYADKVAADKAREEAAAEAKAKKVKTVTVNTATVNAKALDKAVKAKGGSVKYVTKFILGSKVKKISPDTFKKYRKVTLIELRTKKLTKKTVKNSLRGSKVKTVKVNVSKKKKANKGFVKKYKKIFTKKNAGRKVSVK